VNPVTFAVRGHLAAGAAVIHGAPAPSAPPGGIEEQQRAIVPSTLAHAVGKWTSQYINGVARAKGEKHRGSWLLELGMQTIIVAGN
jgi:hypothetical protein